jgi:type VI secretion system secreted protein VgrG
MALLGSDTTVTGPDFLFLLETFQGKEALGIPYRYDMTLLSDNPSIPVEKVLGETLTVGIKLFNGESRYFSGVVTYFSKLGLSMSHARYAVVLNPKLSLFDYTRNCRIFNDSTNFDPDPEAKTPSQNTIQIATQVLKDRDFTDVKDATQNNHVEVDRRYCVQYRETDLNFVQRLLEDEGIYYFFTHDGQKHTMVLADSAGAHSKVNGYESVLYLPKQRRQQREEEHFWSLSVATSLYPGKYSILRGYDYTTNRPVPAQVEDKLTGHKNPGDKFEDYDYPGGLIAKTQAELTAEVRMQGDQVANTLIEVEGNTIGLGVGDLVKLHKAADDMSHHPFWSDADFGKDYLITAATYSISINQYESGDAGAADEPFKARYTLLDSHKQFRPSRTAPKPRIEGPQTAVVVGPSQDDSDSKEEIYTDKLGRVKVKFDWDRSPGRNQKSSCWVRVSHVWAGQKWGAVHIPRVGQEVIVEFLDGDPDRPLITGRVYNHDNVPPYDLPDNMTQSGIKSRSSKGGAPSNFNEIRFEDLKGKEELHIQAERDMSTLVKRNQSNTINAERTTSVGANDTVTVNKDREVHVKGNLSTTVDGEGGGSYQSTHSVTGKHNLHASSEIKIDAPDKIELICGGSSITMVPDSITIRSGGKALVYLTANVLVTSNGGGSVWVSDSVLAEGNGKGSVLVDATVSAASAGGGATMLLSGSDAQMNASTVLVHGTSVVVDGGGKVELNGSGVAVTGAMIKLNS